MSPKTYRKKPVEIQAMQWTGDNRDAMKAWIGRDFLSGDELTGEGDPNQTAAVWVDANSVWVAIETGEWVLRDSRGFYPCKPDIFEATYEAEDGAR